MEGPEVVRRRRRRAPTVDAVKLPQARTLSLCLGVLYVGLGVAELITHRAGTPFELLFWGGSLVGGGLLVVAGAALRPRHRPTGLGLLTIGAVLGMNATAWTLVVPVLAILVLVLAFRDGDRGLRTSEAPSEPPAGAARRG
jgi:hypothetical protein